MKIDRELLPSSKDLNLLLSSAVLSFITVAAGLGILFLVAPRFFDAPSPVPPHKEGQGSFDAFAGIFGFPICE